jgi:hypothetical protein
MIKTGNQLVANRESFIFLAKISEMIQRIQSIYLLLVTVLMSFMVFMPFAELILRDGQLMAFHSYAINKYLTGEQSEIVLRTIPVIALIFLIGTISFANIFVFNRRIIQMRLCLLNLLLTAILLLIMIYYYVRIKNSLPVESHSFRIAGVFPAMSFILSFLAYRGIHDDEMLVRSYDHLR